MTRHKRLDGKLPGDPAALARTQEALQRERQRAEEAVRHLAAIVEHSTDAIISADLDGTVLSWNAAAERLYGYAAEEIVGRSLSVLERTENDHQIAANLERVKRGLPVDQLEAVRRRKDGSLVDVSVSVAPLTDGHGRTIAVTSLTRDISATKQAGRALRVSEERYRLIVETAFEGIWIMDAQAITTFVNPQMAKMLGYTVGEMLGKPVLDFLDAEARARFAANQPARMEGKNMQREVRYTHKDGSKVWTLLGISPNFDSTGTYSGALAMVTDITAPRG